MNASWVAIDLMEFAVRTEDAVQSPEAALEWLRSFRDTLLMEGRNSRPMPWAVELLGMADVKIAKKSIARMQGQIVKIYGKDCDIDLECSKKYGEKYEKLKNILAATTSDGVDLSTTGCNHYDQETDQVSTNSPAGAGVNLDSTHTISPDASVGNEEGVNTNGSTITRNGSRAVCTSATSWQTISATEALEQPGEGGTPGIERTSSSLPSPTPVKPKTDPKPTKKAKDASKPEDPKYPHGEFENIMLTTREYTQLCERLDNADSLIEEADGYFEAQPDKKRKYKSHYAMLLNWDRRRKEFEGVKPRFKTAVDRDQEEIRKLAEYYAEQESDERRDNPKMKLLGGV